MNFPNFSTSVLPPAGFFSVPHNHYLHRGKYWALAETHSILGGEAFVCSDSFQRLVWRTPHPLCSGVMLVHSSAQVVFQSWIVFGALWWTLFFSSSFIAASMIWSLPGPRDEEQPHAMMFPPPSFTVGIGCEVGQPKSSPSSFFLSSYWWTGHCHTCWTTTIHPCVNPSSVCVRTKNSRRSSGKSLARLLGCFTARLQWNHWMTTRNFPEAFTWSQVQRKAVLSLLATELEPLP